MFAKWITFAHGMCTQSALLSRPTHVITGTGSVAVLEKQLLNSSFSSFFTEQYIAFSLLS